MVIQPYGKTPEQQMIEDQYAEIERLQARMAEYEEMHAEMTADLNTHRAECVTLHRRITELEQRGEPVAWLQVSELPLRFGYTNMTVSSGMYEDDGFIVPLYLAAPSPEDKPCE